MEETPEQRLQIGDLLYLHRRQAGWDQLELAKYSDTGITTITNTESGRNTNPHRSTVLKWAQAFGLTPEEFLSGKGLDRPKVVAPVGAMSSF